VTNPHNFHATHSRCQRATSPDLIFVTSRLLFLSTASSVTAGEFIKDLVEGRVSKNGQKVVDIIALKLDTLLSLILAGTPMTREAMSEMLKFGFNVLCFYPRVLSPPSPTTLWLFKDPCRSSVSKNQETTGIAPTHTAHGRAGLKGMSPAVHQGVILHLIRPQHPAVVVTNIQLFTTHLPLTDHTPHDPTHSQPHHGPCFRASSPKVVSPVSFTILSRFAHVQAFVHDPLPCLEREPFALSDVGTRLIAKRD
jgi:hypothetical protein